MAYAEVSDVERMVGDLVNGRVFLDSDREARTVATSPSRSEVMDALNRAQATLDNTLLANDYVAPVTATSASAFEWIKEVNAALVAARLLNALPIREQDNFSDGSNSLTRRTQTYENQVNAWIRAVENGRFSAPHSPQIATVAFNPPARERQITSELGS